MKNVDFIRNHKIMKSLLIIAALLCLETVAPSYASGESKNNSGSTEQATTKKRAANQQKRLVNAGSQDECEGQGGTWKNGKCHI